MGNIETGKAKNRFKFDKAGVPRVYIKDVYTRPAFSNTTTLAAAADPVTTTISVATGTGSQYVAGDLVQVKTEKMYVSAILTDDLTVVRGVDGTTATAHALGDELCQYAEGIQITAALTAQGDDITGNTGATLAENDILRPDFGSGKPERLRVTDTITTVIRDINLTREIDDELTWTYDIDDIFVRVGTLCQTPFTSTNLDTGWFELETVDGCEINEEITKIETQTDQAGFGDTYMDVIKYTATWNSPITDPVFMGWLDSLNMESTSNSERVGRGLKYKSGAVSIGFNLFIEGQENFQRESWWMYNAQLMTKDAENMNKELRTVNITASTSRSEVYDVHGVHSRPKACGQ